MLSHSPRSPEQPVVHEGRLAARRIGPHKRIEIRTSHRVIDVIDARTEIAEAQRLAAEFFAKRQQ